jgi:flagella basal body P-ring formation protein FlgA
MIRTAFAAALVLIALHDARGDDTTPRLRELVTVTGDLVRIGDLVDNAGAAASIAVFRAPDLGQTGSVPTAQVVAALRPHEIAGIDTGGLSEVIVTRLSRAIAGKDIEERIARALAGHRGYGNAESLKIALDRELRTLHVEISAAGELSIARLHVEPRTGRFDISLEIPGSASTRSRPLRFTGTVTETVEAATLVRPLARGEVVRASDVSIERRPKSEVIGEALSLDDVVGLAVKRAMRPGQALRAADLAKPEVVQRNEPVTIVYEIPGMMLTVRGKALEPGSIGDHISVLNIQSNRTVQVAVAGPGRVVVRSNTPRELASAASIPNPSVNQ